MSGQTDWRSGGGSSLPALAPNGRILETDSTQALGIGWSTRQIDANLNDILNFRHLGPNMTAQQPTFANVVTNLTVAFNASQGSDALALLSINTAAAFAGAAANTTLFTVNMNTTHSTSQAAGLLSPTNTAAAALGGVWYGQPSTGFGFGGFDVKLTVALPAGSGTYTVTYHVLGN